MMGTPEDLVDVSKELTEAIKQFDETETVSKAANMQHTDSVNRLNKAQKAFDAKIEEMKKSSAWNTEWHAQRNRGVPVER